MANFSIPALFNPLPSPNLPIAGIRLRQARAVKWEEKGGVFGGKNLPEFQYTYDWENSDVVNGVFGAYSMWGYKAELGRDLNNSLTNLEKLRKNDWIDNETLAFVVEINYYNVWKDCFACVRMILECSKGRILNKIFRIGIFTNYADKNVINLIIAIFFIQFILYSLKILFEYTLIYNKFLILGQILHIVSQSVLSILLILRIYYDVQGSPIDIALSGKNFVYLYKNVHLESYIKLVLLFLYMFYPFKIFHFLSWFKSLSFLIKFSVTIYRTIPGLMLFFMFLVISICIWTIGFMMVFQDYLGHFRDYGNGLASLFILNFGNIESNDKHLTENSLGLLFLIVWMVRNIIAVIIIAFFIAFLADLIKKAAMLEYMHRTNYEKEIHDKMGEFQIKFDKFLKSLKLLLDKDKKEEDSFSKFQNRILIWLHVNPNEESIFEEMEENLKEAQIQAKRFVHTNEVLQFLEYLFRLKPNLLSFRAGERFRIVAEATSTDSKNIEILIDWLKQVGCRVPMLVYSSSSFEKDVILYMKKKYPSIIFVWQSKYLRKYCLMEESIQNFLDLMHLEENKEKLEEGESGSEGEEDSYYE